MLRGAPQRKVVLCPMSKRPASHAESCFLSVNDSTELVSEGRKRTRLFSSLEAVLTDWGMLTPYEEAAVTFYMCARFKKHRSVLLSFLPLDLVRLIVRYMVAGPPHSSMRAVYVVVKSSSPQCATAACFALAKQQDCMGSIKRLVPFRVEVGDMPNNASERSVRLKMRGHRGASTERQLGRDRKLERQREDPF